MSNLGDRMKAYEAKETLVDGLPLTEMNKTKADEAIKLVFARHQHKFTALPLWILNGTTIKRIRVNGIGHNPITGCDEPTVRNVIEPRDWAITCFNPENIDLISDKYWAEYL